MVKRKSKHTCRKRAAHNGGGKRKPAVAPVAPGTAAGAASAPSSGSESDHSALRMNVMAKAVKTSADASPRASRAWTPLPSARASPRVTTPQPTISETEKALRNAQKLRAQIEALMLRPVAQLNRDQQQKLVRYVEVAQEVERLQAALATMVHAPEDANASSSSGGEEDALPEMGETSAAPQHQRHVQLSSCGSDASSCRGSSSSASACDSSHASASLSLASVVSATAHELSEYYEEPRPPTPPTPPPPLRRSDVAAGTSTDDAYAERERWVRQVQATFRRKAAQRRRRAREEASQAATNAFAYALEHRTLKKHQLLMVEHVLRPRALGQPNGRLRGDFLQLYGDSRMRGPQKDGKQGKSKLDSLDGAELGALSRILPIHRISNTRIQQQHIMGHSQWLCS